MNTTQITAEKPHDINYGSALSFDPSFYAKNGYCIVKGLLSASQVKELKDFLPMFQAMVKNTQEGYKDGHCHIQSEHLNDGSYNIRKVHNDVLQYPRMLELYAPKKLLSIVKQIIGDKVYFHHSKYMCKPAGGGVRKPWHQDLAYWAEKNRDDVRLVTVWTALDHSTKENGCIQVIPGSHLGPLLPHSHKEDFMIDESLIAPEQIIYAEMEPGDSLFFDVKLLHASAQNNSTKPRQSTIIDFSNHRALTNNDHVIFDRNFGEG